MRIILYILGFGVPILLVLNLIASSNLISIFASPATNVNVTSMPSSLDSAKSRLADAIRLLKSGNIQAAIAEVEAANHIITQFRQSMRNVMNTMNRNAMIMPRLQQQAQPEVQNMNNNSSSAMAQSPLMVGGGKLNQNEMKNMLSSTANNNTNSTNNIMGGNTTSHFAKK